MVEVEEENHAEHITHNSERDEWLKSGRDSEDRFCTRNQQKVFRLILSSSCTAYWKLGMRSLKVHLIPLLIIFTMLVPIKLSQ